MSSNGSITPPVIHQMANETGLNEYLFLQQIRAILFDKSSVYHHTEEGLVWVRISYSDLHRVYFNCVSIPTLKRIVTSLREQGLLFVKTDRECQSDRTNLYRINADAYLNLVQRHTDIYRNNCFNTKEATGVEISLRPMTTVEQVKYNKEYDHELKRVGELIGTLELDSTERQRLSAKHMERFEKKLKQKYDDICRR